MAFLSCKPLNSIPNTKNARVFLLMLVWWFLITITLSPLPVVCIPTGTKPGIMCKEIERQALLTLKAGLVDKAGRLSSWSDDNPNCCNWKGVSCRNHTGHVFKLNLRNPFQEEDGNKYIQYRLEGEISSSLVELKYLEYLDLSRNDFTYTKVPAFLGSLEELRYLNLYSSSFSGVVPPSLGNLSRLEYLDLGLNYYGLKIGSWQWLTGMSSLTYLNLDWVDLSKAEGVDDWLGEVFNKLPNLLELHLSDCGLSNLPMSINHHPMNFTSSFSVLDLSSNNFNSSLGMPPWLFNITGLVDLQLSDCYLAFNIPHEIGRLVALQQLDLSDNDGIGGQLPASLGNLTNLVTLNLGNYLGNYLLKNPLFSRDSGIEGTIPVTFRHLCKLRELDLGGNRLEGDIHEFIDGLATCSSDHPDLETLHLPRNKLIGTLPSSLGSLSNLVSLDLSFNSFCGSIPTTIGSLTTLISLRLYYNKMNGTFVETIGRLPPNMEELDLSYNQWQGQMLNESHFEKLTKLRELSLSAKSKEGNLVLNVTQDWLPPFRRSLVHLDLDGVKMSSKMFPRWTQTLRELDLLRLKNCGIADSIPNIGQLFPSLYSLDLSSNSLSGAIPRYISRLQYLRDLSLRNNLLNGELTHLHWENLTSLSTIDLSNNRLVGKIPQSLSHFKNLHMLKLNDNRLEGEIPAFPNLSSLKVLDLGGNKLSGNIPPTLASHNPELLVFRLRGNMLSGTIPLEFCLLLRLQTLDLAHNNFTGTIPTCLGNLSKTDSNRYFPEDAITLVFFEGNAITLVTKGIDYNFPEGENNFLEGGITLVVKGREYKYDWQILRLVHLVDLSHNNLSGNIPVSLMNLTAMQTLNLSMNHLTGDIPSNIGLLHNLETLDLSQNHLSGPIPSSISDISSLNYLNLSHNDLSGRIPLSRQLQTLDTNSSSYDGNPLLCGVPLPTKCPGDSTPNGYQGEGEENVGHDKRKFDIEEWGFVLSIVLGFVVGFWGVCGSLVLKPSWRQAYFGYLVGVKEKIIVAVVLNVARFRRKMGISK